MLNGLQDLQDVLADQLHHERHHPRLVGTGDLLQVALADQPVAVPRVQAVQDHPLRGCERAHRVDGRLVLVDPIRDRDDLTGHVHQERQHGREPRLRHDRQDRTNLISKVPRERTHRVVVGHCRDQRLPHGGSIGGSAYTHPPIRGTQAGGPVHAQLTITGQPVHKGTDVFAVQAPELPDVLRRRLARGDSHEAHAGFSPLRDAVQILLELHNIAPVRAPLPGGP